MSLVPHNVARASLLAAFFIATSGFNNSYAHAQTSDEAQKQQRTEFVACFDEKEKALKNEEIQKEVEKVLPELIAQNRLSDGVLPTALNHFYRQYQLECAEKVGLDKEVIQKEMDDTAKKDGTLKLLIPR
jgi:hypothetical protein